MGRIYESIDQLIGCTPLAALPRFAGAVGAEAKIFGKLEYFNPAGSAKDRVAKAMIEAAEKEGLLKPGSVIIEPTSGNTGVGLAAIGAVRGYETIIVMPETMSQERRRLIIAHGARLELTDGKEGLAGSIKRAEQLKLEMDNAWIAGQFENPANPQVHELTTGPEIWSDTDGNVDIFVAGVGTGGTISGVGHFLKGKNPAIRVVAVEPAGSPVLSGGEPGPHGLQGIGAGFKPGNMDLSVCDEIVTVTEEQAYEMGRLLASSEGYLVGISAGAALYAAVLQAKKPENRDKNIVVFLTDTGERYLSTPMFAD